MNAFNLTTVVFDRRQLSARFWLATFQAWRKSRAHAISLAIFLVAIVILQLAVQVLLNLWNRNFFDALERRDAHGLWIQTQLFFPLAAASIFLAATSVWGRMAAQRGWRKVMSQHVIGKWLEKNRLHRLNHLAKGSENPEYRIAVDVRIATDAPVDMALAMFSSGLTAITFFSVLWTIGGSIDVVLFGRTITIPGYLVFGVVVYSGIMSILMTFLGHHLTNVIDQKNQSEAEFGSFVFQNTCPARCRSANLPNLRPHSSSSRPPSTGSWIITSDWRNGGHRLIGSPPCSRHSMRSTPKNQ